MNFYLQLALEKTHRHFDRSVPKGREVEKSIQKQISRLAYGSLEMTTPALFYRAFSLPKHGNLLSGRLLHRAPFLLREFLS